MSVWRSSERQLRAIEDCEQRNIARRSVCVENKQPMSNKLYIGNLSFQTLEIDLHELFAQAGAVSEVALMQIA